MAEQRKARPVKSKARVSVLDRINSIREERFRKKFFEIFGIAFEDVDSAFFFDLEGEKKLVFRNLSERFKRKDENSIIGIEDNVFVLDDGSKYEL